MGKVTVTLDRLKNLKDTDGAMNHPDPYVIFTLEKNNWGPMDKKYGKQTSTTKRCTCNPKVSIVVGLSDWNKSSSNKDLFVSRWLYDTTRILTDCFAWFAPS